VVADDRSNPKNWLGSYADPERDWLALRAAERPAYLASALAEYLELREWTPEQLAEKLRCAPQLLAKLGLCRRPELSTELHQQVSQIASRFELDYWVLRRLLEELGLEPQQRQIRWVAEESFNPPEHRHSATRAGEDFIGVFGASHSSSGQDFLENLAQASESGPDDRMEIPPAGQVPASAGATAPKTASPRTSWLARLFHSIRGFFAQK
jgi:hypothetical protein